MATDDVKAEMTGAEMKFTRNPKIKTIDCEIRQAVIHSNFQTNLSTMMSTCYNLGERDSWNTGIFEEITPLPLSDTLKIDDFLKIVFFVQLCY